MSRIATVLVFANKTEIFIHRTFELKLFKSFYTHLTVKHFSSFVVSFFSREFIFFYLAIILSRAQKSLILICSGHIKILKIKMIFFLSLLLFLYHVNYFREKKKISFTLCIYWIRCDRQSFVQVFGHLCAYKLFAVLSPKFLLIIFFFYFININKIVQF